MKIAIASDHAGFKYKESVKKFLRKLKIDVQDCGTNSEESVDYPDYGYAAAKAVSDHQADKGIIVCGSGVGMSIVANKVKGIRAALSLDKEMAKLSRQHNDANVLVLGERLTDEKEIHDIVKVWLDTPFEGGRHERRIKKIHDLTGM
jgi:ribose 5-phosphate isomerase B